MYNKISYSKSKNGKEMKQKSVMKKIFSIFFLIASTVFCIVSSIHDAALTEEPASAVPLLSFEPDFSQDTWTVLVYMCASDLEERFGSASADIEEILAADTDHHLNLILQTGTSPVWNNKQIAPNKMQRFIKNKHSLQLITEECEGLMTAPDTLATFITESIALYPADHYALILWDHGGGTQGGYGREMSGESVSTLSIPEFSSALDKAGTHFDFIGFDACLMSSLENALALAPYSNYLIASEEKESRYGWFYTNFLSLISARPSSSVNALANQLIEDSFTDSTTRSSKAFTLALIDLQQIPSLAKAVDAYFSSLCNTLFSKDIYADITHARSNCLDLGQHDFEQIDLLDFVKAYEAEDYQDLSRALSNAVVISKTSLPDACGLGFYFPFYYPKEFSRVSSLLTGLPLSDTYEFYRNYLSILVHQSSGELGELCRQDWYNEKLSFYQANRLPFSTDEPIALTRKDGYQALHLSADQWDTVLMNYIQVYLDNGSGFIDLSFDDYFEYDDEGDLIVDYDYKALFLDDHLVSYHVLDNHEFEDGSFYTYGYVPALLNSKEDIELIVVWDSEHEDPYISGYKYPSEAMSGVSDRGLSQLKEGDRLEFYFDYYSYDGDFLEHLILNKNPLKISSANPIVAYKKLSSDTIPNADRLLVSAQLQDIYLNVYHTETAIYEIKKELLH